MINDTIRSNRIDRDSVRDVDLHGRRFRNGGDSLAPQDFVTRNELDKHLKKNKSTLNTYFTEFLSRVRIFVLNIIAPPVDSTTAIRITKANQTTNILIVDTLNEEVEIVSGTLFVELGNAIGQIVSSGSTVTIGGGTATNLELTSFGSTSIKLASGNTIGFFGATPVVKQTLAAYSSDGEGSAYGGAVLSTSTINYKDHAGANQSMNVVTGPASTFALVSEVNQLRVAYETLRASYDDLRTKLQNTTLVG